MSVPLTRRSFLSVSLLTCPGLGSVLSRAAGPERLAFKLGIITDEVSEDLAEALEFISGYALGYCELREVWRKNIMNLSSQELERAKQLIEKQRFRVSAIASPIFKYNLPEMPAKPSEKRDTFLASFTDQDTEDLLNRAFKLARLLGTNKVRIFSYWRVDEPEKAYPYVRDRLAKAAGMAAKNKIFLVLENEPACNIGSGKELGRIVRDVNSPYLRAMWDPGNAVVLGEVPYPDGYQQVRGLFPHMHVKDAKKDPKTGEVRWAPVGNGEIDFPGQFKALLADGYKGTVSLETHYRRPDGNARESTRESLEGLLKVLRAVG